MANSWNQYITTLKAAPRSVQDLFAGERIMTLVDESMHRLSLPASHRVYLGVCLSDTLLCLKTYEELRHELSTHYASATIEQLLALWQPLITETLKLYDTDNTTQAQTNSSPTSATSEPLEKMRTMPEDMQRIHGYGAYRGITEEEKPPENEPVYQSNQDSVLNKHTQLADTPDFSVAEEDNLPQHPTQP